MNDALIAPDPVDAPLWRVVIAFLVAPGAGLGLLALMSFALERSAGWAIGPTSFFLFVLMAYCAYPTAFLVGVPTYLLGRKRYGVSLQSCFLVAAVIAAATWGGLLVLVGLLSAMVSSDPNGMFVSVFVGVVAAMIFAVPLAALGAVSGLVFWFILNVGRKPPLAGAQDPA